MNMCTCVCVALGILCWQEDGWCLLALGRAQNSMLGPSAYLRWQLDKSIRGGISFSSQFW